MPENNPDSSKQPVPRKRASGPGVIVALVGYGLAIVGGYTVAKTAHEEISDLVGSEEFSDCVDDLSRPDKQGDPFDYAILSVQRSYGLSEFDARKVAYETLISVCVKMAEKDEIKKLENYFMRSLGNGAKRLKKKAKRRASLSKTIDTGTLRRITPEDNVISEQEFAALETCMKHLSIYERELILYRVFQDTPWEEMGATMGKEMSGKTARRQYDEAMQHLRNICSIPLSLR